jgi:hypothetical protein
MQVMTADMQVRRKSQRASPLTDEDIPRLQLSYHTASKSRLHLRS